MISKEEFFEFYQAYLKKEHQANTQGAGGGDFYANQNLRIGRRFAKAVIRSTKEGQLLYREAYQLTGLRGDTFSEFAERLDSLSQL